MRKMICTMILILATIFAVYSQIEKRRENTNVALKPQAYDSLTIKFEYYDVENMYQYKKYIGQSIFFKPYSKNNINGFVIDQESTVGAVPIPYERTDIGQILSQSLVNAKTKQEKANLQKQYKDNEAAYLAKFTVKTNLYKPIISNKTNLASSENFQSSLCNNVEALSGKSFLILDVFAGHNLNNKIEISSKGRAATEELLFKLLDENKDTLYWKTWSRELYRSDNFIIQGYYDKQKKCYVGRQFIYRDQIPSEYTTRGDQGLNNDYEKIIKSNMVSFQRDDIKDFNTKESVSLKDQDVWQCVDLSIVESSGDYNLYYIMKNNINEIKIPAGKMVRYGLVLEDSYNKEQGLRKLKQEEFDAWQKAEEAKRVAEDVDRKKCLLSKYGNEIGMKVYNGQVSLGMTKEMCRESWGHTSSVVVNSVLETWVYGYGNLLTFSGNKLVKIVSL